MELAHTRLRPCEVGHHLGAGGRVTAPSVAEGAGEPVLRCRIGRDGVGPPLVRELQCMLHASQ